jgi:AcrR family transcriptional regulator
MASLDSMRGGRARASARPAGTPESAPRVNRFVNIGAMDAKVAARRRAKPAPVQTRDPDASRAAILKAATDEFARHGLGGARVDRIADTAGVNKRMLYYYFGNKEDLFLAVLEQAYRDIRDAERALELSAVDPVEGIRRLIAFTWTYYLEHPEFLRLLNSENQHRAEHLKRSSEVRAMHSPFVAMIDELLERGRRSGVFRAGVDPVQLYISIASLSYFYLSNRHTLSTIFGRELLAPRERAERLGHMTDLVLGYLIRN